MSEPGGRPGASSGGDDRFAALFSSAPVGIALMDADGVIAEANAALGLLVGRDKDQLAGMTFEDLLMGPSDAAMLRSILASSGESPLNSTRTGMVLEHADEGALHVEVTVAMLPGDDPGRAYPVIMVEDVNDLHLLQERLHHQNIHDPLTGLPNAASFHGRLESAMAERSHPHVALLLIDIDGFRVVNDAFGANVGDQLLRHTSTRLRASLPRDAVIARLAGDGFGVLLRGTFDGNKLTQLTKLVDQTLHDLAEPIYPREAGGVGIGLSASVGIVVRDAGECTAAELEQAAEITVHRAKSAGRAQWMMADPEQDGRDRRRARRGAMIGGALETGQFELTFEPTIRPDGSDQIVLLSTDMRWNHPEEGPLQAADFLDMADLTGMTLSVGQWMLGEAIASIASWRTNFGETTPSLSVPIPHRLAVDQDLVGMVRQMLSKHDLPPEMLSVVTKARSLDNPEVAESLTMLGAIGVQTDVMVAVPSDFERCASDVPLRYMVLDERLVASMAENSPLRTASGKQALDDMMAKPRARGIKFVADGVTCREIMQTMAEIGVVAARGPVFHEPLTAAKTEGLLASQFGKK